MSLLELPSLFLAASRVPDKPARWDIYLLFSQGMDDSVILGTTHEHTDLPHTTPYIILSAVA